jgi:hypothetical protein
MRKEIESNLRLLSLIEEMQEAAISTEGIAELDGLLKSSSRARRTYLECSFLHSGLQRHLKHSQAVLSKAEQDPDLVLCNATLLELAADESTAPRVDVLSAIEPVKHELIRKVRKERMIPTFNKTSWLIAVTSLAALFLMIAYVYVSGPAPYEVATVSDSIGAKWSSDLSLRQGSRISCYTKPIQLTQGVVKFETDDGVEVVLEAPTEFRFVSYSEVALSYGKLFARVSEQGYGFSVATPNAKIIDLGTEFSVLCHIDGNTEVHMYKGKANLLAGQKNESKSSELLDAGAARNVDRTDSTIRNVALDEHVVVRHLDSRSDFVWRGQPLNIADIIGSGSGFEGGRINRGIDATTGRTIDRLVTDDTVIGTGDYHLVPDNPYVDGVFVPGAGDNKTQISSSGFVTEFPKTNGAVWGYIFNGAMHKGITTPEHALRLDGAVLGTPAHPAVCMHSNQGITLDLTTIRRSIPGLQITSFRSGIGISQTVQAALEKERDRSYADYPDIEKVFQANRSKAEFWVFMDGVEVYRKEITSRDGSVSLNIPVPHNSRFLTLAVTESDDTQAYDWAVLARPELVLDVADSIKTSTVKIKGADL